MCSFVAHCFLELVMTGVLFFPHSIIISVSPLWVPNVAIQRHVIRELHGSPGQVPPAMLRSTPTLASSRAGANPIVLYLRRQEVDVMLVPWSLLFFVHVCLLCADEMIWKRWVTCLCTFCEAVCRGRHARSHGSLVHGRMMVNYECD